MSANLITGNLFKPIYAYQDADYQAGISGNVTSIMPVGSQMALSIEDANTIKADDGVLITKEGRRIQIDAGAIEEWSIPTGTQGQTNYFIIGFHLYTDSNSAEVCETFVEQMENATDTISENTFRSGATEVYISLGRVVQNGINLESVTSLVQIAQSFEDVKNAITQLNNDLPQLVITVKADGSKTYAQLITELKNALSLSGKQLRECSYIEYSGNTVTRYLKCVESMGGIFTMSDMLNVSYLRTFCIVFNTITYGIANMGLEGFNIDNQTNLVPTSDSNITLKLYV